MIDIIDALRLHRCLFSIGRIQRQQAGRTYQGVGMHGKTNSELMRHGERRQTAVPDWLAPLPTPTKHLGDETDGRTTKLKIDVLLSYNYYLGKLSPPSRMLTVQGGAENKNQTPNARSFSGSHWCGDLTTLHAWLPTNGKGIPPNVFDSSLVVLKNSSVISVWSSSIDAEVQIRVGTVRQRTRI